jgi:DNA-directed RNA polymerase subunit RPC12/RpoP
MKLLTTKYVGEQFAREDYQLLTIEYINSKQKLGYICPKGHEHSISWDNWKSGKRCPYCAKNGKPDVEFIRSDFAKEGYWLLTNEYINAHQKLEYICPNNHKHVVSWGKWRSGRRCPYCSSKVKKTIEFIKSEFAKEDYKLLITEYINCKQKLDYICPKGHRHNITWGSWKSGSRCPYCANRSPITIEFVRSKFAGEGYILLIEKYINSKQKLDYMCPEGHKYNICWGNWQQGKRCPYCIGNGKLNIEFIKSEFEKEGYRLLATRYNNACQKLKYICPNNHRHNVSWNKWQQGRRCPYCAIIASKGEIQVRNFIKSLGIKVLSNNRDQIFNPETGYGFELDIFIPTLNKAVEYNGEYWHQDKNRDLLKQQLCESEGINLLTVWDSEWKIDNGKCKNKIMEFIFDNNTSFIGGLKNLSGESNTQREGL